MFQPSSIRAEMARNNLTADEVARRSGLSPTVVYRILNDKGNPTVNTIEKIAKAIGVDSAIFFAAHQHNSAEARQLA